MTRQTKKTKHKDLMPHRETFLLGMCKTLHTYKTLSVLPLGT